MTIDRIGGSGIFAGMPLDTSDNGDPKEWIAFWHTDEEKMDRIVEALQDAAEGEESIEEMETLADCMFAVQNPPGASERALRIATEARVIEVESRLCARCRLRPGVELHEIIPRRRVQGSPAALREVFKSPELCALACKECHPYGRGPINNWWMRYKIGVYGLERVKAALERVNKHLTDPVTLAEFNVSKK
jgi:hypothetical protein